MICTTTDIQPHDSALPDLQCFWEAFPSGSGPSDRTTYMFTYVDAQPQRPSLQAMMEEYWKLMPSYQVRFCQSSKQPVQLVLVSVSDCCKESPLQEYWQLTSCHQGPCNPEETTMCLVAILSFSAILRLLLSCLQSAPLCTHLTMDPCSAMLSPSHGSSESWYLTISYIQTSVSMFCCNPAVLSR